MCLTRERQFTSLPGAPAQARQFVREQLTRLLQPGVGVVDVLEQAELLTSEVAANAVKASRRPGQPFEVDLAVHHAWFQVAIVDSGAGWPELQEPAPDEPRGRGLRIVAAIAMDWGARPEAAGGKAVWFRLPLPAGAAEHLPCKRAALQHGQARWAPPTASGDRPVPPRRSTA